MKERGGCLFILTGLLLGLVVGALVSFVISPMQYVNVSPAMLKAEDKDIYRGLIAAAYHLRGDLGRAKARIGLLQDENSVQALTAQAQQTIAKGGLAQEARGLALLAAAMNEQPILLDTPAEEPPTEVAMALTPSDFPTLPPVKTETTNGEPEETPIPPVVFPTIESRPIPSDPYVLKDRKSLCDLEVMNLLQVFVIDKSGKPIPGAEVIVTWQGGEDHFFTGLKPQVDLGYADFTMVPGELYNLRMANGGDSATRISPPNCKLDSGMEYTGGVKLIFGLP